MSRYLPLAILGGFLLELASIIAVGRQIGVLGTIMLVLAAGVLGAGVIKRAGLAMLEQLTRPNRDLKFASEDAASRFLLMLAGVLFILPGFVSDVAALVLLPRPVRSWLARRLASKLERHGGHWHYEARREGVVIEGEAVEIEGEITDDSRR